MTVKELLELLEKVDDKDLPIRVLEKNSNRKYDLLDINMVKELVEEEVR